MARFDPSRTIPEAVGNDSQPPNPDPDEAIAQGQENLDMEGAGGGSEEGKEMSVASKQRRETKPKSELQSTTSKPTATLEGNRPTERAEVVKESGRESKSGEVAERRDVSGMSAFERAMLRAAGEEVGRHTSRR